MVEQQPSKLNTRVRFPSPAPIDFNKPCFRSDSTRAPVMATFAHGKFGPAARLRLALTMLAVVSIVIWSESARPGRAAAAPAPSPDRLERITEFFNNEVATGRLPGAVVLIQQHGRPVYLKCFGVRDVMTNVAMTPDTIFALHSMTKPITSLAAMMLVEAGKLGLSDPVARFIPAFADTRVGVSAVAPDGTPVLKLVPADRPVTIS